MKLLERLEGKSESFILFVGFSLISIIGIADSLTGYEFAFSEFDVVPIYIITWFTNRRFGLVASILSALVWISAEFASGSSYSHPLIPVWNTIIKAVVFVFITIILSELKKSIDHEKKLAHTDYLTGAVNSRLFHELIQVEINHAQRSKQAFTIAYIDLDNFKFVNDKLGHPAGDNVLRAIVHCAKSHIRKIDIFARLGGDEFALLMPETDLESSRTAIEKLRVTLLEEMQNHHWPITFSIGALTCNSPPSSPEQLIKMADELMYSVKHGNKNATKHSTYGA